MSADSDALPPCSGTCSRRPRRVYHLAVMPLGFGLQQTDQLAEPLALDRIVGVLPVTRLVTEDDRYPVLPRLVLSPVNARGQPAIDMPALELLAQCLEVAVHPPLDSQSRNRAEHGDYLT